MQRRVLPVLRLHLVEVLARLREHVGARQQIEHRHRLHARAGDGALVRNRRRHGDRVRPVVARAGLEVRRETQRHGRQRPRNVADVVRAAAALVFVGLRLAAAHLLGDARRQTRSRARRAPSASPWPAARRRRSTVGSPTAVMLACIVSASVRFMCDGHAEPSTLRRPLGVGHQAGAFGHLVADLPHVLDAFERRLAEVVPDARHCAGRRSAGRRRW